MKTTKQIHELAGRVDAACIILHEVRMELLTMDLSWGTEPALTKAKEASDLLRILLRKISYEVENVREDT